MANYADIPPYVPNNGRPRFKAVLTITLGELIESGLFDWANSNLDWSEAAYSEDQYTRVCEYFNERFYWREISMEPYKKWAMYLKRKLVYELMPKYRPLYARVDEGVNPLSSENEYYKSRKINSEYPETMLSGNSDYLSNGTDEENQRIKEGPFVDAMADYAEHAKSVDEMLLDELEIMFVSMYTVSMNSSW